MSMENRTHSKYSMRPLFERLAIFQQPKMRRIIHQVVWGWFQSTEPSLLLNGPDANLSNPNEQTDHGLLEKRWTDISSHPSRTTQHLFSLGTSGSSRRISWSLYPNTLQIYLQFYRQAHILNLHFLHFVGRHSSTSVRNKWKQPSPVQDSTSSENIKHSTELHLVIQSRNVSV